VGTTFEKTVVGTTFEKTVVGTTRIKGLFIALYSFKL